MKPRPVRSGVVGNSKAICDFSGRVLLFSGFCGRYGPGNVDWRDPVEGVTVLEPVSMFDAIGTRSVTKVGEQ